MQTVGNFGVGSIVNIAFKYDDNSGFKFRPAVIISFDNVSTIVALLKITTHSIRTEYDMVVSDAQLANLKVGSVIRCNHVMHVSNTYKCKYRGTLCRQDIVDCTLRYKKALLNKQLIVS